MLEELLEALEQFPEWKDIREAPERISALEARLSDLEAKVNRLKPQR